MNRHRIATTLNGLSKGYMTALRLPVPTLTPYRDYSARVSRSDGGEAKHGYAVQGITFPEMSNTQFFTLKRIILTALANGGRLYATLPRSDGSRAGTDWIDVSGIPAVPDGNPIAGAGGRAHSLITVELNDVIIENDPAVF